MPDADCGLARLDPLQLAWAAGLFDGEGSTLAAARSDRPNYRRLEMTVPQCGHDGVPEVLLRFQAAVLGMGNITGPNENDMYFWRAGGFAEAQATIALLWSQLGAVKRHQAATAMAAVQRQYDCGEYRPRASRRRGTPHMVHAVQSARTSSADHLELAWAAGFLDGEGHFGLPRAYARRNAPDWRRIRASAAQNGAPGEPPEVLLRMKRIFGGTIERHGEPDDFRWLVQGLPKVRDVLQRVRPWLGTVKQEQARLAIEGFAGQVRLHGTATHCARGHEYTGVYLSATGPKQRCQPCDRILRRMKRAQKGIKPRQFKNVARRYTF